MRITILSNGAIDYEARRQGGLEKAKLVKALRALAAKLEREEDTSIFGPTGETLTTEARLGDLT